VASTPQSNLNMRSSDRHHASMAARCQPSPFGVPPYPGPGPGPQPATACRVGVPEASVTRKPAGGSSAPPAPGRSTGNSLASSSARVAA